MKLFLGAVIVVLGSVMAGAAGSVPAPESGTSGIYLSGEDYKNGILSYAGECHSKNHELELHDILNKSYVHVTHGREKRKYAKADLFGFRACNGRDYRFVSNKEYRILEAKELYIYNHEVWVSTGRSSGHTDAKFYFSAGSGGKVFDLTLEDLKRSFPENHSFHKSLDQMFGTNRDLEQYDELHKMFAVNWLFVASETTER